MAFVARAERKLVLTGQNGELGPGSYIGINDYKKVTNFAPFSSSVEKSTDKKIYTPGPGSYLDLYPKHRGRQGPGHSSAFASHSSRFDLKKEAVPGPGSYNIKASWTSKRLPARLENSANWVRLPSAPSIPRLGYGYEETTTGELVIHKGPAVIGGDSKESVGPGHYNLKPSNLSKGLDWKKSKNSQRDTFVNKNECPGPGSYSKVEIEPKYKIKPNAVFISASKRPTDVNAEINEAVSVPGPGKYDFRGAFTPNPNPYSPQNFGSCVQRFSSSPSHNTNLGPGSYNFQLTPDKQKLSSSKVPFTTKETRFKENSFLSPGPGSYHGDEFQKKVWGKYGVFGCTEKRFNDNKSAIPGPGHYESERQVGVHNSALHKGSSVFVSKSKRMPEESSLRSIPPPGSYEVTNDFGRVKSEVRTHINLRDDSPKIAFNAQSERWVKDKKNNVPGPTSYRLKDMSPSKSVITSKDKRFKLKENPSPGPGFYSDKEHWNKKTYNSLFDNNK
jgi:hypothetical protein